MEKILVRLRYCLKEEKEERVWKVHLIKRNVYIRELNSCSLLNRSSFFDSRVRLLPVKLWRSFNPPRC